MDIRAGLSAALGSVLAMDGAVTRGTQWVADLRDGDLVGLFDRGTLERAAPYAHDGAILDVSAASGASLVLAEVQGSRARPYQVLITRHSEVGETPVELSCRCSCPVQHACKHAAAVLLYLREVHSRTARPTGPPDWRRLLEGIAAVDLERADQRAVTRELPGLVVLVDVVRQPARWGQEATARVELRSSRMGRTGRPVRNLGWDTLARGRGGYYGRDPSPMVRPEHAELALELLALDQRESHYAYRDRAVVDLAGLGPAGWQWVSRALDAGVDVLPGGAKGVRLDPEAVDVVVALTGAERGGLRMSVHLDGFPDVALDAVTLVGSPPHTLVVETPQETQVRPLGTSAELVSLLGMPATVHPGEVADLVRRYLPVLRRHARVTSPDEALDVDLIPWTRLVARVASSGPGVVTLEWGTEEVLPDGALPGSDEEAAPPFVPLPPPPHRTEVRELIGRVAVLTELPDVRARGIRGPATWLPPRSRYTGADAVTLTEQVLPRLGEDELVRVERITEIPEHREAEGGPLVHVSVDEAEGTDWFDLHVEVRIDDELVPVGELLDALSRGEPLMLLPSGTWFRLDRPELERLRELLAEAQEMRDPSSGQVRLSRFDVGYFDELVELGVVDRQSAQWARQVETLRSVQIDPAPAPPDQLAATLRPYQQDGYQWLSALWDAGLGGILADDMGLGKTMQVLATIGRAQERGELDDPVLVIAPTSVLGTWVGEAQRFAPGLRVLARPRTSAKSAEPLADAAAQADVVVTSYAVARIDAERFAGVRWSALVLDEAHSVKNHQSKTYRAIRALPRRVTFAVTGTPVENSLMDLWALLSLAAPGLYPRPDRFAAQWRRPIERGDHERLATLRRRVRPLMLRRTKDEVALDLPPKTVQVLPVVLAPAHRRMYDRQLQRERQRMLGLLEDPEANRVAILASLTRLRQLALDPRLVADDTESSEPPGADSAKIEVLVEHLLEIGREGHRALVFSQFTSFLALVGDRLRREGIGYGYLDGATADRQRVVEDFRRGDDPVFLISLKAGGVGLTLTEADYVFVLDPWWNPAAESQAIDRAHRIGQERPVVVYRMVSADTIEDKVVALQDRKRDLVARAVDDDPLTAGVSADDLVALLDPPDQVTGSAVRR